MSYAVYVRTPTDFERTIGADSYFPCPIGNVPSAHEPTFRECIDALFADLQYVDATDSDMIRAYLSSIEVPLRELSALGFAIIALMTKGRIKRPDGVKASEHRRRYYLIVPVNSYFRIGVALSGTIRRFHPDCIDAVNSLVRASAEELAIGVWNDRHQLDRELEGNVPWCPNCC